MLRGRTPALARRLRTVYYDTPALDLSRHGVSLRVRRDGSRWVQTVKGGGLVEAGLHQRDELERVLAGPRPDLARLGRSRLAAAFASAHVRSQLRPLFLTDFHRSRRLLEPVPGLAVEAALDRGEIQAGARREAISELELELKQGEPAQLIDFALRLLQECPLAVENRSKAERGLALARGRREAPVKSRSAALTADMTVMEAFAAVIRCSLAHLQANERGMLDGADPEYLHQMRVAVRRLRSAFSVFAPEFPERAVVPLAAELRWLGRSLSSARDWDVFVTETLPPVLAEFGEHPALAACAAQCAEPRRAAGRRARSAVRSRRYHRLQLALAAWLVGGPGPGALDEVARAALGAPVLEFARVVLEARHARMRKRGRKISSLSAAELHRLRIATKKFRYAADFFAGLYDGRRARAMLKCLSRLQNILGAINDAATVGNLMSGLPRGMAARQAAEAKGILLGWSRGRAATLRRELKSAWRAFTAAEKFW